jgi:hypothetical protein
LLPSGGDLHGPALGKGREKKDARRWSSIWEHLMDLLPRPDVPIACQARPPAARCRILPSSAARATPRRAQHSTNAAASDRSAMLSKMLSQLQSSLSHPPRLPTALSFLALPQPLRGTVGTAGEDRECPLSCPQASRNTPFLTYRPTQYKVRTLCNHPLTPACVRLELHSNDLPLLSILPFTDCPHCVWSCIAPGASDGLSTCRLLSAMNSRLSAFKFGISSQSCGVARCSGRAHQLLE